MLTRLPLFYAVRDIDRARALFEAVLNVKFAHAQHLETSMYWSAPLPDGAVLELWPAGGKPVTQTMLEFAVDDLGAAAEQLTAAGFEVRRLVGTVLATDPNGNTVALTSAGAARAPRR